MNFNQKVSIIVPCFNQAQFLGEALDSILAQTYSNWECIIVNDGSSDNTEIIANFYLAKNNQFKYIYQNNAGLSSARNTGIKNSSGEYILPLDSDDKISPSYIEEAVKILNNNSQIKIVYSNAEFFGAKTGLWKLTDFSLEKILLENMIFCTALYRRTDYDKTVGYNSNMIYGWEDWDLWLSILEQGGTVYKIPKTHFFYRIRNKSMVRSLDRKKMSYLKKQLYLNHIDLYSSVFGNFIDICRDRRDLLFFNENSTFLSWITLIKILLKNKSR